MKLKLLALVVLLAVGIGAVILAMGGIAAASGAQPRYLTATVSRGTVSQDVTSTGTGAHISHSGTARAALKIS